MSFADVGYLFRYMEWAKTVMEAGLPGVIDIGSSGIAQLTRRELGLRISDIELSGPHFYGEPELRRRIARLARAAPESVLPTLGASHAHFLACASMIEPGDEVIVETPGYEVLSALPRALGAIVVPLERRFEDGFQFDPDELRRLVTHRTRVILVTNLHNPSGVALSRECLAALTECAGGDLPAIAASEGRPAGSRGPSAGGRSSDRAARADRGGAASGADKAASRARADASRARADASGAGADASGAGADASGAGADASRSRAPAGGPGAGLWVVVNEVYRDFVFRNPPPAGHTLGPRGVSIGSLTKVYGLGETRVGWIVGDPTLIHRASRVNDFGVVNGPYVAERIGAFALARRAGLLARARAILGRNRPVLERFLRANPALDTVKPAGGTVVFPRLRGIADSKAFAERALAKHRVCVVPGEFFGAPGHIRIGIGGRDTGRLEEGLRRLGAALNDEGLLPRRQ